MSRRKQHAQRRTRQRERAAAREAKWREPQTPEGRDCSLRWADLRTRGGLRFGFVPVPDTLGNSAWAALTAGGLLDERSNETEDQPPGLSVRLPQERQETGHLGVRFMVLVVDAAMLDDAEKDVGGHLQGDG